MMGRQCVHQGATIGERDTMDQVRVPIEGLVAALGERLG